MDAANVKPKQQPDKVTQEAITATHVSLYSCCVWPGGVGGRVGGGHSLIIRHLETMTIREQEVLNQWDGTHVRL